MSLTGVEQSPKTPNVIYEDPAWPEPYYLERDLRRVLPYFFTYKTYCKERWRGKTLLAIYSSEFRDRPVEYYVCAKPL
jgi:tRNA pseudouridine32 synthase